MEDIAQKLKRIEKAAARLAKTEERVVVARQERAEAKDAYQKAVATLRVSHTRPAGPTQGLTTDGYPLQILEYMRKHPNRVFKAKELREAFEMSPSHLSMSLKTLSDRGLALSLRRGYWTYSGEE